MSLEKSRLVVLLPRIFLLLFFPAFNNLQGTGTALAAAVNNRAIFLALEGFPEQMQRLWFCFSSFIVVVWGAELGISDSDFAGLCVFFDLVVVISVLNFYYLDGPFFNEAMLLCLLIIRG